MSRLVKVTYYPFRKDNCDNENLDYTSETFCNVVYYDNLTLNHNLYIEFKGKEYLTRRIPDYQFIKQEVIDHD